jgi:hypothetical protein
MDRKQTIIIKNSFDVTLARMQVRQRARAIGLGIQDQACIALATSSLAHALKLGEATEESTIDIYSPDEGERLGVQVVCKVANGATQTPEARVFADTRWMVDELTVETLPPNDIEVTLVKWAT